MHDYKVHPYILIQYNTYEYEIDVGVLFSLNPYPILFPYFIFL